jgi:hypothetical protein
VAAAKTLLPEAASAYDTTDTMIKGSNRGQEAGSANNVHYKLPFKFAMGSVPLGIEASTTARAKRHFPFSPSPPV